MPFIPNSEKTRKLLLLYVADKFIFPLTEDQFIKIVLDNEFMNYVDYKECLNDLIEVGHIIIDNNAGIDQYKISDGGKYALDQFVSDLPDSTKEAFDKYLKNNLYKIKKETLLDSSYKYLDNGQMEITCNVRENNSMLMTLKMYIGDEDTAKEICENWETASPVVYQVLLDTLLRKQK